MTYFVKYKKFNICYDDDDYHYFIIIYFCGYYITIIIIFFIIIEVEEFTRWKMIQKTPENKDDKSERRKRNEKL